MTNQEDEETRLTSTSHGWQQEEEELVPGLTLLAHPETSRISERLALPALAAGQEICVARGTPVFSSPSSRQPTPLGDRSISRRPLRLIPGDEPGAVTVDPGESRSRVIVDGDILTGRRALPASEVERGVVLQLGRRVVLLLHHVPLDPPRDEPGFGLVGESPAMVRIRQEVRRLAGLEVPVLVRGATGTGKELVARALHRAGPRRQRHFLAVNMAALPTSLAAVELFGAVRGAYTGAGRERVGYFEHAQGGTLFFDEIGDTPPEVQPMLLRALEENEILPVGAVEPRRIDVRIIAATDALLGGAIQSGHFRAPLFHRLAGYSLHLPPLVERRADVGGLASFFLDRELGEVGAGLGADPERPWPPAEVIARLARHHWPGNVRELRNVCRWLVINGRGTPRRALVARLESVLAAGSMTAPAAPSVPAGRQVSSPAVPFNIRRRRLRKVEEVDEAELLIALETHRYKISATAEALGVSRANLYRLIDGNSRVRKAAELSSTEIAGTLERHQGDLQEAAAALRVSLRGLKRRITALELGLP